MPRRLFRARVAPSKVLPSPRAAPAGRSRAGFTLIEVLAAFAILAGVAVVVHRGVVAAATSSSRAADVAAAARVARAVLGAPLELAPDATLSGTLDGHAWSLATTPLPIPGATVGPDDAEVAWAPVRIRLSVEAGRASPLAVESVRLVKVR